MNNETLIANLKEDKLIAVTSIGDTSKVEPLVDTLLNSGVKWLELTFRNPNTADCLRKLKNLDSSIHYGAGTVRTLQQAQEAVAAGSEFLVSPGFNAEIVSWANENEILFIPGVNSTYAIEKAQKYGLKLLKFFPAVVSGGINWLKAIKGPYFDIDFIPTGGINIDNFSNFLTLSNVIAAAGSFLAKSSMIEAGEFEKISQICSKAKKLIQ